MAAEQTHPGRGLPTATVIAALITTAGGTWVATWPQQREVEARNVELRELSATLQRDKLELEQKIDQLKMRLNEFTHSQERGESGSRDTLLKPEEPSSTGGSERQPTTTSIRSHEVSGIRISVTSVKFVGDELVFYLDIDNVTSGALGIDIFGGGNFNGHSRIIAQREEYPAAVASFGKVRGGIAHNELPANQGLKGTVSVKGVPLGLTVVDVLELAYSYENMRPAGFLRFQYLPIG